MQNHFFSSVPLFSLPVIFLLHWNTSRLVLDPVETDCSLSHLASECLKCLLSVHLIGFHLPAQYADKHISMNQNLHSKSNQYRTLSTLGFLLFLASSKLPGMYELTPFQSHSHYTTFVATCVPGRLQMWLEEFSLSASEWVHSHLCIQRCLLVIRSIKTHFSAWCDSVRCWGSNSLKVERGLRCRNGNSVEKRGNIKV